MDGVINKLTTGGHRPVEGYQVIYTKKTTTHLCNIWWVYSVQPIYLGLCEDWKSLANKASIWTGHMMIKHWIFWFSEAFWSRSVTDESPTNHTERVFRCHVWVAEVFHHHIFSIVDGQAWNFLTWLADSPQRQTRSFWGYLDDGRAAIAY